MFRHLSLTTFSFPTTTVLLARLLPSLYTAQNLHTEWYWTKTVQTEMLQTLPQVQICPGTTWAKEEGQRATVRA